MDSNPDSATGRLTRRGVVPRRLRWTLGSIAALLVAGAALAPTVSGGGPGSIAVSASLAGCERSGGAASCRIDVTFSSLGGADYYTASVTRPDGSTQAFGQVGAGSASLPVAYAGDGHYVVTISAWSDAGRLGKSSSG